MGWRHIGHLGVARENRMLVGSIACRCAIGLTRLKSDDYTCRTVRKWLVDAGSIPASSTTHHLKPTFTGWLYFFLQAVVVQVSSLDLTSQQLTRQTHDEVIECFGVSPWSHVIGHAHRGCFGIPFLEGSDNFFVLIVRRFNTA